MKVWVPDDWQVYWTEKRILPQGKDVELHLATEYLNSQLFLLQSANSLLSASTTCSGIWYQYNSAEYIYVSDAAATATSANAYCQSQYGANITTFTLPASADSPVQHFLHSMLNSSAVSVGTGAILTSDGRIDYSARVQTAHGVNFTVHTFATGAPTGPVNGFICRRQAITARQMQLDGASVANLAAGGPMLTKVLAVSVGGYRTVCTDHIRRYQPTVAWQLGHLCCTSLHASIMSGMRQQPSQQLNLSIR